MSAMPPAPPNSIPRRHALKYASQLTIGLGTFALLFTHYLANVVEKPNQNTTIASRSDAMDPETTGSIGNRASGVWANPCSVLDRTMERAH